MNPSRRDIIVVAILAAFPLAVIACLNLTASWFQMVADDGLSFITPLLEDGCRQIMNGNVPWWSHHTLCGFPVIGRGCGSFYPPHLLVHVIKSIVGVTTPTFFISIVLHISLCAVSSYCYLRYIGCRIGSAAVGALGYAMAGPAFGFACNWPRDYSIPFAYLPLAFLFIEEALARRTSLALVLVGGFIGGNVILMAHPQMMFKMLLICAVYLGMRSKKNTIKTAAITCLLAIVIALLIGSVQIAATLELLKHSLRVTSKGLGGDRVGFSLSPVFFLGIIFPFIQFDWPEEAVGIFPGSGLFVGPLAAWALIAGLCYWRRTRLPAGTFLLLAGCYFLLSLGNNCPGEAYLGSLPMFRNFRYPIRWSSEFCAVSALASGIGLELLLRYKNDRLVKMIFSAFIVCLVSVMILNRSRSPFFNDYYWMVCVYWAGAVILLWFLLHRYHIRYFLYGAVIFTAVGMVMNIPIAQRLRFCNLEKLWHQPLPMGKNTQDRVLFLGTMDPPTAGEGNFCFNMPHYFGGRTVFGYDSLKMREQKKWKYAISITGETEFSLFKTAINTFLKSHLMQTLRVGWVVMPKVPSSLIQKTQPSLIDACISHPDLEKIKEGKWMAIFRNNGFKNPAFFIRGLRYDNDLTSGADMGKLELSRYAWIESGYRGDMNFINTESSRVSNFSEEHGNIDFSVKAKDKGFVVVTSTWYPGWVAYIDNRKSPFYRVNSSFIGLPIPEGDHLVALKYEPTTLRLLLYAGVLTYGIVVILLIRALIRFKRHPNRAFRQ